MLRTVTTDGFLEIGDLGQSGILATGAQQVAEEVAGHSTCAATVEEGECFFVVGRGLVFVIRHCGWWDGEMFGTRDGLRGRRKWKSPVRKRQVVNNGTEHTMIVHNEDVRGLECWKFPRLEKGKSGNWVE